MESLETKIRANLTKLFKVEPSYVKKTDLGLTNDNYYIVINSSTYLLRYPFFKKDSSNEKKIIELVKPLNIDVHTIYYDAKTGVKITKYIDAVDYDHCNDADKIIKVAYLMRKLHQANIKSGIPFNPIERLNEYRSKVTHNPHPEIEEWLTITNKVTQFYNPVCLCHNEWVSQNLLFTPNKSYLIDYEYAGDNDPLFDIASFFSQNDIDDIKQRESFLYIYFQNVPTDKELEKIKIYEALNNLLWYYWALMMYEIKHDEIYLNIANHKFKKLQG